MSNDYRAKRVSLQVWLDPEDRRRLKVMAANQEQSVTEIVRLLIKERLDGYDVFLASRGKTYEQLLQEQLAATEKAVGLAMAKTYGPQ